MKKARKGKPIITESGGFHVAITFPKKGTLLIYMLRNSIKGMYRRITQEDIKLIKRVLEIYPEFFSDSLGTHMCVTMRAEGQ